MNKRLESLTIERMSELLGTSDGLSDNIFLSKDISVLTNVEAIAVRLVQTGQPFRLPDFRCGFIRSGSVRARINLLEHTVRQGCIGFLTPGTIIQPIEVSPDFHLCGMAISPEMLHLALRGSLPSIFNGSRMDGRVMVEADDLNQIAQLLQLVRKNLNSQDDRRQVVLHLTAAYLHLFDRLFAAESDARQQSPSNGRRIFDRFIYLVNNHCKQEHQMKFYADSLCLTERYLGTVVRQVSGVTAKEWIDRAIVASAKVLLKHGTLPMVQIADELNFPNVSFFCKFFKRLTGCTPLEYRRQ